MKRLSLIFMGLLFAAALAGCSESPKPQDALEKYVKAWNNQQYEDMYAMLSKDAKQSIDKKTFVNRYKDIYQGIETSNLEVSYKKPEKEEDIDYDDIQEKNFTYHVKMNTLAGKVSFDDQVKLMKEKTDDDVSWRINWDTSMIFPQLKKGQTVHAKTLSAERGEIYDRNGKGLAINGEAYEISLVPGDVKEHPKSIDKLANILDIDVQYIKDQLDQSWVKANTRVPIKTVSKSDKKTINQVKKLKPVITPTVPARQYPCGAACAHLTGYTGGITGEEYQKLKDKGYTKQSSVGKRGLESLLEDQLHGKSGGVIYINNSDGDRVATIAQKDPVNGQDTKLTIDRSLQQTIYQQMKGDAGTATAIHPKKGGVLALVSTPAFDPNQFVLGISSDEYKSLQNDSGQPLITRFSKTYAPGSTMKPLTTAVALKNKAIQPDTTMTINSTKWQKDSSWGDYYVTRLNHDTRIDLHTALVKSDNIYFARTALKTGQENFVNGLQSFGFGEKLGLPFPMEPSSVSKNGSIDSEVALANSGYGQGQVNVNPLHMSYMYSAFINDGNIVQPHLLKGQQNGKWKQNLISSGAANTIHDALVDVVQKGTASEPNVTGIHIAGKTGTAEYKKEQGKTGRENGWFVAYDTQKNDLLMTMMIADVQDRGGSHYVVKQVKNVFKKVTD
ncbi:penicillin-binding transpeptidase domain-containing protein [Tuberibacillus sp. Marseille-P3662]|uniref:penicillin-binding transpeptidase domain-containing protein n=1 Tax=Tuberibacillus sp. Marseille-P3662 TaxID=1965358 RepID=UPI000A1CD83A|nr:penicillin-binding transpeptidase domain-containing protein [Tuberibacillus sp. Marseille-P3662]